MTTVSQAQLIGTSATFDSSNRSNKSEGRNV